MSATPLTLRKVTARRMDEISPPFKPGDAAEPLYRPDLSPIEYLAELKGAKLYPEVIRLLAALLPQRDGIEWAVNCVRDTFDPTQHSKSVLALATVDEWLTSQTNENSRNAGAAAELTGVTTPIGCLASAVFYSGANISSDENLAVSPPPTLQVDLVAAAVILAAVTKCPEDPVSQFVRFINIISVHYD